MKSDQRPAARYSSVFLLAFQGMEVVYDASHHQITSRLASARPDAPPVRDAVTAPRREEKRP